ncbi:MAG: radical SAM protein [Planctomycetota bacterium]|jgi:MoaA/NifB/PqqE/SkfB family radical SAM enzyme
MRTLNRFLALAGALKRGTARDGLPYKLTLILNGNCPTRCSFCSIWKTPSPDELSVEEWDRILASAPETVWANLSGGEIFLRPDLPELIDALTARMRRLYLVDFPTTGWYPERTLDACERLVKGGVPKVAVTVSLDGPPELHDQLRGREGAYAKAVAAMRALRDARLPRVKAYFGMTLLPENHEFVDETVAAACAAVPGLTARDFHFNVGMESAHYYRNAGAGTRPPDEVLKPLEKYRRRGLDPVSLLERAYQKRVPEYLETGRSPVPCTALRASVFVDARGVVYPCSIYDRPLGDLRENSYDLGTVVRAAEARRAREAVVEDRCPGCWTPCEAYQSLLAGYARSSRSEKRAAREPASPGLQSSVISCQGPLTTDD